MFAFSFQPLHSRRPKRMFSLPRHQYKSFIAFFAIVIRGGADSTLLANFP